MIAACALLWWFTTCRALRSYSCTCSAYTPQAHTPYLDSSRPRAIRHWHHHINVPLTLPTQHSTAKDVYICVLGCLTAQCKVHAEHHMYSTTVQHLSTRGNKQPVHCS
jgi:hypothetical protein